MPTIEQLEKATQLTGSQLQLAAFMLGILSGAIIMLCFVLWVHYITRNNYKNQINQPSANKNLKHGSKNNFRNK